MPKLSDAKLEAGIFDGLQIRTLFNDASFTAHMTDAWTSFMDRQAVWTSFRKISQNFLGNNKSQDYEKLMSDIIKISNFWV